MQSSNNTAVKTQPEDRIIARVREAWDGSEGVMSSAVDALFADVAGRPELLNSIMPQILRAWCRDQIGDYAGKLRIAAMRPAADPSQGGRLRVAFNATLYDYPLPSGKRLGDANAREIREGSEAYSRTAEDASHKARWLAAVADRVGRKNRAENALSLTELEQLFEDARHG